MKLIMLKQVDFQNTVLKPGQILNTTIGYAEHFVRLGMARYADGEQAAVKVAPVVPPVVESKKFSTVNTESKKESSHKPEAEPDFTTTDDGLKTVKRRKRND